MTSFAWSEADDALASDALAGIRAQLSSGRIELDDSGLHVTFGSPAVFATDIPRSAIVTATRAPDLSSPSRGVHGHSGKWLVNRSGQDLVRLRIDPPVPARLTPPDLPAVGGPTGRLIGLLSRARTIRLRELTISVASPDELVAALGPSRD